MAENEMNNYAFMDKSLKKYKKMWKNAHMRDRMLHKSNKSTKCGAVDKLINLCIIV